MKCQVLTSFGDFGFKFFNCWLSAVTYVLTYNSLFLVLVCVLSMEVITAT